jgi:Protein of unknown function (DUF3047)
MASAIRPDSLWRPLSPTAGMWALISFALLFFGVFPAAAQEGKILFYEGFRNLDNWKPLYFPKIEKRTAYSIESKDDEHYLRAESNASASGLVYKETFNVYDYPTLRWRWRISNIYQKGDGRAKGGDDYPIRIYVLFEYDPGKAGVLDKMRYGLAKAIYGEYPPQSAINYVWSSVVWDTPFITSPHTDKVKVVALESGTKKVGTWQEEQVDILQDYKRMFGTEPPAKASLGIMNDSDNTGEHAVSFISFIEVRR